MNSFYNIIIPFIEKHNRITFEGVLQGFDEDICFKFDSNEIDKIKINDNESEKVMFSLQEDLIELRYPMIDKITSLNEKNKIKLKTIMSSLYNNINTKVAKANFNDDNN